MPTVNTFDLTTALVDGNQKVALDGAVAKLQPDADNFGAALDAVQWTESRFDILCTYGAMTKYVLTESGGKWSWADIADTNQHSSALKREVAYDDADIITYFSDTDPKHTNPNGYREVHLWLWRNQANMVWIRYKPVFIAGGHTIEVYKIINNVFTNLATSADQGLQSDIWLRIKRDSSNNTFTFYYALSDPAVGGWTQIYSGIINDATYFNTAHSLYPVIGILGKDTANIYTWNPENDYYRQETSDIDPQRFWNDSPEIYVINGVGDQFAFDAGAGYVNKFIGASIVSSEPGTSTVKLKGGVSQTGLIADVIWKDDDFVSQDQFVQNAKAGNYSSFRYMHIAAQFNSDGDEQPSLTSITMDGGPVSQWRYFTNYWTSKIVPRTP